MVGSYADVVESVDRVKLVAPLQRGAHDRSHEVDVLLQVSLDPPDHEGRSGADAADLAALAQAVDDAGRLRLRGLMAVAPLGDDPVAAFARLAEIRADFCTDRPDATWLSAGMSTDFEAAIEAGATHVRVGSAILGPRPRDPVASQPRLGAPTGTREPEDDIHERRDAQDRRVPRPARGHRRLRRRVRRAGLRRARAPAASCAGQAQPAPVADLSQRRRTSAPAGAPGAVAELSRITTLHPRTYNEARVVGENFRDGVPVIMNLSEMDDADAKRLVDFAAGLVFATRGTIERVTQKVFLLSPPNVSVAAEEKQRLVEGGFFNQS